jgi:hypothetical protein
MNCIFQPLVNGVFPYSTFPKKTFPAFPIQTGEGRSMDFLIPFRHVHTDEMDSSSMAAVSDDLSRPVYDGPVGDSFVVEPSLGQYTDEMVLSFFVQTVELIT